MSRKRFHIGKSGVECCQEHLGTVQAGKLADIVILNADPLADIQNTPSLRLKIAGFNVFDRSPAFFDGHPVPFDLKSITEMDLLIDETFLRRPGRYSIVVKNPPPPANNVWGDGTSNTAWLLVSDKDSLTAGAPRTR